MPLAAATPPDPPVHLLMPFAASLLYVGSALFLKRASQAGAGVWRSTFAMNVMAAAVFAGLPLVTGTGDGAAPLWQPAVVALTFVVGQACTMYALNRGDVSVATPVVGTKVVFVAFFVAMVGGAVTADLWASAAMSAGGIVLLNLGGRSRAARVAAAADPAARSARRRNLTLTIAASLSAAASYGLFDTLMRQWGQGWGAGRLLATTMAFSAAASIAFVPLFEGRLRDVPRAAVGPLLAGAFLLAFQAMFITLAVGWFADTPRINVVYNARGLWSVLAVWLVGHWFGNRELTAGGGVLRWRVAGAGLLLAAILVAILQPLRAWGAG
jgi:hypothetical protein